MAIERKLLNLTLDATPPQTYRIAIGENGVQSKNIQIDQFITLIKNDLNVYTQAEVNTLLTNYLSKSNVILYSPTLDYHPATKKYVDDIYLTKGTVVVGDINTDKNISVAFSSSISTSDYVVVGHLVSKGANWSDDNDVFWMVKNMTASGFELLLKEQSPQGQDLDFKYKILKF